MSHCNNFERLSLNIDESNDDFVGKILNLWTRFMIRVVMCFTDVRARFEALKNSM